MSEGMAVLAFFGQYREALYGFKNSNPSCKFPYKSCLAVYCLNPFIWRICPHLRFPAKLVSYWILGVILISSQLAMPYSVIKSTDAFFKMHYSVQAIFNLSWFIQFGGGGEDSGARSDFLPINCGRETEQKVFLFFRVPSLRNYREN